MHNKGLKCHLGYIITNYGPECEHLALSVAFKRDEKGKCEAVFGLFKFQKDIMGLRRAL